MGRFFEGGEGRPGDDHTIVLSDDFWRRSFGADPEIVGRKIRLLGFGGNEWQVVGVMPPGFNFPLTIPTAINPPTRQMQYWIPMTADPLRLSRDGVSVLTLGRLRPGATAEQADADIGGIAARLAREFPQTNGGRGTKVTSLSDSVLGKSRRAMWTVLLATGLVVLIACANIANLLLARSAARSAGDGGAGRAGRGGGAAGAAGVCRGAGAGGRRGGVWRGAGLGQPGGPDRSGAGGTCRGWRTRGSTRWCWGSRRWCRSRRRRFSDGPGVAGWARTSTRALALGLEARRKSSTARKGAGAVAMRWWWPRSRSPVLLTISARGC